MHALAMCTEEWDFFPVFPVLSLCYPIDASQALHLVLKARISQLCLQTDAQEFWALLSLALAVWLHGTGHHPISLAISVPSACLGFAPHSSYAPCHLLGSNAEWKAASLPQWQMWKALKWKRLWWYRLPLARISYPVQETGCNQETGAPFC